MTALGERAHDTRPGPERNAHAHFELQAPLAALQTLPEIDLPSRSGRRRDVVEASDGLGRG